jgi:hypothetical protein
LCSNCKNIRKRTAPRFGNRKDNVGPTFRQDKKKRTRIDPDVVKKMKAEGKSAKEISKELGISVVTVFSKLKK